MSGEAAAMTRGTGANRTFRSIFGDAQSAADQQQPQLQLQQQQQQQQPAAAKSDEEDELWDDEAPPGDAPRDNNADGAVFASAFGAEEDAAEPGDGGSPLRLDLPPGKTMAEWAEDDEDEEVWKDALQARVNQLDLFRGNNTDEGAPLLQAEARASIGSGSRRGSGRHKVQRTSSGHSSITADASAGSGGVLPPPSPQSMQQKNGGMRKRPGSKDFVKHNIRAAELRRSESGGSASSRADSPSSAALLRRKGSVDSNGSASGGSSGRQTRSDHSRASGGGSRRGSASAGSASGRNSVVNLSETEAIRRFVVNDIKQMSMERLVNNAKRLNFLEDFFQQHQPPPAAPPSPPAQ